MAKIKTEHWDAFRPVMAEIAKDHLFIETLEPRNMDSLDFHDCSVVGIKAALQAAFAAGFQAARTRAK